MSQPTEKAILLTNNCFYPFTGVHSERINILSKWDRPKKMEEENIQEENLEEVKRDDENNKVKNYNFVPISYNKNLSDYTAEEEVIVFFSTKKLINK